jgi:2-haloacid dehalogenase
VGEVHALHSSEPPGAGLSLPGRAAAPVAAGLRQINRRAACGIIDGMDHRFADIRALTFDVFGTVVDWRSSVIVARAEALGSRRRCRRTGPPSPTPGAPATSRRWRACARGELPWTNIDGLHRRILDALLATHGLQALARARPRAVQPRLAPPAPWPDSVAGLQRLKKAFTITTLSNGNLSLLVDMARHAGLPWDAVLTAELFHHYKPDPQVYLGAARLLGLPPGQVMMVAAHPFDLVAAQRAGLKTAYVPRPDEYGRGGRMEPVGDAVFDITAERLRRPGAAAGSLNLDPGQMIRVNPG